MNSLSTSQRYFIGANLLVAFGTAISSTFFNIFLFRLIEGSIPFMAILYLCKFMTAPIAFVIGCYLTLKMTLPQINGLSLIILVLVISFPLMGSQFAQQQLLWFVVIVGIIWGLGDGLYWMSFNSLQQVMVEGELRAKFIGVNGGFINLAYIMAPLLATILISQYGGMGYIYIFLLIMVNYLLAFLVMLKIKVKKDRIGNWRNFRWSNLKNSPILQQDFFLNHLIGFREGLLLAFLSILYLQAFFGDDITFGIFNTINAVVLVCANFIFAKIYHGGIKFPVFFLSIMLLLVGAFSFGLMLTTMTCLLFGIIYNLAGPGFIIPTAVRSFAVIDEQAKERQDVYINLTWRECAINLGRMMAMIVVIGLYLIIPDYCIQIAFVVVHLGMILLTYEYRRIFVPSGYSKRNVFCRESR